MRKGTISTVYGPIETTPITTCLKDDQEDFQTPCVFGEIRKKVSLSASIGKVISTSREAVQRILDGKDNRLFLVVGPCALQSPNSAIEYAGKLASLQKEVQDSFILIMRAYYEKARSFGGWKGFMYSGWGPENPIEEEDNPSRSLIQTRKLLLNLVETGVPLASELLDPIASFLFQDLITWASIGARTVHSQPHRLLASNLPMPCGIKNSLDGSIHAASSAVKVANSSHTFLGVGENGRLEWISSRGNPYAHIVLRGGTHQPNYSYEDIEKARKTLEDMSLNQAIVVDCSHGNSQGDTRQQIAVFQNVLEGIALGKNRSVKGLMIESFLEEGTIRNKDLSSMPYEDRIKAFERISHVDPCLDWATTEKLIRNGHRFLQKRIYSY